MGEDSEKFLGVRNWRRGYVKRNIYSGILKDAEIYHLAVAQQKEEEEGE